MDRIFNEYDHKGVIRKLKQNNVYGDVLLEMRNYMANHITKKYIKKYCNRVYETNPEDILQFFSWTGSQEGYDFWYKISRKL